MPSDAPVALAGLLGAVGASGRTAGQGDAGGTPATSCACRRGEHGRALSGGGSTLCHTGARAGVLLSAG